jgi:prepilin-type N-terminal cleavage/methylation domain-containing protein
MKRRHLTPARGFTLIEALVALMVLGLAVGAILTPITIAIEQQRRSAKMTVATVLAEQAVEECLSHRVFSNQSWPTLGPGAGKVWRDLYDQRTDYHNISEGAERLGMVHGPALVTEFPQLRRTMWLQPVYLPGEDTSNPPRLLMLTVRVFDGDEELVTLRRLVRDEDE